LPWSYTPLFPLFFVSALQTQHVNTSPFSHYFSASSLIQLPQVLSSGFSFFRPWARSFFLALKVLMAFPLLVSFCEFVCIFTCIILFFGGQSFFVEFPPPQTPPSNFVPPVGESKAVGGSSPNLTLRFSVPVLPPPVPPFFLIFSFDATLTGIPRDLKCPLGATPCLEPCMVFRYLSSAISGPPSNF